MARRAARFKPARAPAGGGEIGRRGLFAGLAAAALPSPALPATPPRFLWGVAASAPQTEGSGGRGQSVWDVFAAQPGRIKDGSTMAVGTGFESRFAGDFALAAGAGLNAFRFSTAWPRIQPEGRGAPAPRGLDLYDRMVDAMLAHRLEPFLTVLHWDVPAALPGAWTSRQTALRFAEYAAIVARRLGDRVRHIALLNEPGVVAMLGYGLGWHAPGMAGPAAMAAATHHQNLAQGLGIEAVRTAVSRPASVGTVLSLQPVEPATPGAAAAVAARRWDAGWNGNFLGPLYGRPYPREWAALLAPLVRPGDMATIAARPDFLGVNYYSTMHIGTAANPLGAGFGAVPPGTPLTGIGWPIEPAGLIAQLRRLRENYGNPPVYLSETGAAWPDPAPRGGVVSDPARIGFLRRYLAAALAARREGSDLRGAFVWTLTDNWEWAEGFTVKFGLVQVDRATLARTPKTSLGWYGAWARAHPAG